MNIQTRMAIVRDAKSQSNRQLLTPSAWRPMPYHRSKTNLTAISPPKPSESKSLNDPVLLGVDPSRQGAVHLLPTPPKTPRKFSFIIPQISASVGNSTGSVVSNSNTPPRHRRSTLNYGALQKLEKFKRSRKLSGTSQENRSIKSRKAGIEQIEGRTSLDKSGDKSQGGAKNLESSQKQYLLGERATIGNRRLGDMIQINIITSGDEEGSPKEESKELKDRADLSPQQTEESKSHYIMDLSRRELNEKKEANTPEEKSRRARARWQKAIRKVILINRWCNIHGDIKRQQQIYGRDTYYMSLEHLKEKEKSPKCIILPEDRGKLVWTGIIVCLLIFTAIYVPLRIAFYDKVSTEMLIIEYIVDALFAFDIIINFLSAYFDDDHNLIIDRKIIAKKYLSGWFIFDLLACFPFQLIATTESSGKYNKLFRLVRLGRLYRMLRMLSFLRLLKLMRNNKQYEKILIILKMNGGIKRLIKVILTFFLICHFFACMWYFMSKYNEFPPDCWVVYYGVRDSGVGSLYLISLYWVMTLTTVGYGEILPHNNSERLLATIFMIVGVGFCTYTIGTISSILADHDSRKKKLKEKMLALDELARGVDMNPELYYKLKKAIKGNHETQFNLYMDQEMLLEELPPSLRSDVVALLFHRNQIDNIQFFKTKDPNFLLEILPLLKQLSIDQNEIIYKEGDWTDEMFFILKGTVSLVSPEFYVIRTYIQGSYFGEMEIFSKPEFRSYSAIASEDCELLKIKKSELLRILSIYPEIEEEMIQVMTIRKKKNEESLKQAVIKGITLQRPQQLEIQRLRHSIMNKDFFKEDTPNSNNSKLDHFEEAKRALSKLKPICSDSSSFSSTSEDFDQLTVTSDSLDSQLKSFEPDEEQTKMTTTEAYPDRIYSSKRPRFILPRNTLPEIPEKNESFYTTPVGGAKARIQRNHSNKDILLPYAPNINITSPSLIPFPQYIGGNQVISDNRAKTSLTNNSYLTLKYNTENINEESSESSIAVTLHNLDNDDTLQPAISHLLSAPKQIIQRTKTAQSLTSKSRRKYICQRSMPRRANKRHSSTLKVFKRSSHSNQLMSKFITELRQMKNNIQIMNDRVIPNSLIKENYVRKISPHKNMVKMRSIWDIYQWKDQMKKKNKS